MKEIFLIMSSIVLISGSVRASQAREDVVFVCSQFKNANGQSPVGVQAPKLVRLPGDASQGQDLYVRTAPVYPRAVPTYEKLKKVSLHADLAIYESQNFEVHVFHRAGLRANIHSKGTDLSANCKSTQE